MTFEAVGNIITKQGSTGLKVEFDDGHHALIHPVEKVFSVTAPGGRTCSLGDETGAPYLAALCSSQRARDAFRRHLGGEPWQVLGLEGPATYGPDGTGPRVEAVHLVDRYA